MIRAEAAVSRGRQLLGTPYRELDCINFIKAVIRSCPGGDRRYTTAGTNSLYRSFTSSPKYRDLVMRQEGLEGARAGMLAFKRRGEDTHHVGLVTECGTVLHSSSAMGCVCETDLYNGQWNALGQHRLIAPAQGREAGSGKEEAKTEAEKGTGLQARVVTSGGALNLRDRPSGRVLCQLPCGSRVEVLARGEWMQVRAGETQGYCKAEFLEVEEEAAVPRQGTVFTVLEKAEDGQRIRLEGTWRALVD